MVWLGDTVTLHSLCSLFHKLWCSITTAKIQHFEILVQIICWSPCDNELQQQAISYMPAILYISSYLCRVVVATYAVWW